MTFWQWTGLVWGIIGLEFVLLEIPAAFGIVPWGTLSTATRAVEGLWVWGAFFIMVGLTILNIHLVWHFLPALLKEIGG